MLLLLNKLESNQIYDCLLSLNDWSGCSKTII